MMYIEHFVLLAGAYNLGFFIELAEYFYFLFLNCYVCTERRNKNIFLIFKTVVNMHKRETATNHTPVYTFGLGYPPETNHKLFTIQNSKYNEEN